MNCRKLLKNLCVCTKVAKETLEKELSKRLEAVNKEVPGYKRIATMVVKISCGTVRSTAVFLNITIELTKLYHVCFITPASLHGAIFASANDGRRLSTRWSSPSCFLAAFDW